MAALGVCLIAVSKLVQLAIDPHPLLFIDSPEILLNAFHGSHPERSYFYAGFLRIFVVPFHSLVPLVLAQVLAGGLTACLLLAVLRVHARLPYPLAIAAALVFAWDPTQVVQERLLMTESAAGLCGALFLWITLQYIFERRDVWLMAMAVAGLGLVSLRVVYIPIIWGAAVLLPLLAHLPSRRWRALGLALLISLSATFTCQTAYRQLTGRLFQRQPAYHYRGGQFLLGNLASLIRPEDAVSPMAAEIIRSQNQSGHSLQDSSPSGRNQHLWSPGGLIERLRVGFPQEAALNQEAQAIALAAIRRDPAGFLQLGLGSFAAAMQLMGPDLLEQLSIEDGYSPKVQPSAVEWRFFNTHFDAPTPQSIGELTPSRHYHRLGVPWMWVQLISPLLGLLAVFAAKSGTRLSLIWVSLWSASILTLSCLFSPISLRYLHPLSFPGIALFAVLVHRLGERRWQSGWKWTIS
jgi:hypothetical protein